MSHQLTALYLCYSLHADLSNTNGSKALYTYIYGKRSDRNQTSETRFHRDGKNVVSTSTSGIYFKISNRENQLLHELWEAFRAVDSSGCVYDDELISVLLPQQCIKFKNNPTNYTLSNTNSPSTMVIRRVSVHFVDILIKLYILALYPDYIETIKKPKTNPFKSN